MLNHCYLSSYDGFKNLSILLSSRKNGVCMTLYLSFNYYKHPAWSLYYDSLPPCDPTLVCPIGYLELLSSKLRRINQIMGEFQIEVLPGDF